MKWKADWERAKGNLGKWWRGEGMALCVFAPRGKPIEKLAKPEAPADLRVRWTDAKYRAAAAERSMAGTRFYGEAFPYFDTQIGPGSLGTFLGSEPRFAESTVWYEPCIGDPEGYGAIRFEPEGNKWWDVHVALIEEGLRRSRGRYLVGMPDLIENIDTLAQMRGSEELLTDLLDRPGWVKERVAEINEAYFKAFGLIYEKVRDEDGGNAFSAFRIWGPGKTAKVQCDFSCMISAEMFREFVVPALEAQCDWLDYSLYHLDGTQAMHHVEALCEIESLNAIQWTPQAGRPGCGSAEWYGLYRRIKAGGKGLQANGLRAEEIKPLVDVFGPEGLFVSVWAKDEAEAEMAMKIGEEWR